MFGYFIAVILLAFVVSVLVLMAAARLFGAKSATFGMSVLSMAASFFVALLVAAIIPGSEKVALGLSALLSVFVYRKFLEMPFLGATAMSLSFLVISVALAPLGARV